MCGCRIAAHAGENKDVEEMHAAEDEKDDADLGAFEFDGLTERVEGSVGFESKGDVADVDEVETDDKQAVYGIGELDIAVEGVDEEDATALVKGAGDPDRKCDGDREVRKVESGDLHESSILNALNI